MEELARTVSRPWNTGRLVGSKPPLRPKQIWGIRVRMQMAHRLRDLAMFDLAIESKLRASDLVRLTVADVSLHGTVRHRTTVVQQKTGRPVQFELTEQTRESVQAWLAGRRVGGSGCPFPSRRGGNTPITTRQYGRLVRQWVASVGLDPAAYGTHSLRRTKPSLVYKRTGNLRAVQLLLGHTKLESTVRYLGIEVDDALSLSEQTEV
jgi:integrase